MKWWFRKAISVSVHNRTKLFNCSPSIGNCHERGQLVRLASLSLHFYTIEKTAKQELIPISCKGIQNHGSKIMQWHFCIRLIWQFQPLVARIHNITTMTTTTTTIGQPIEKILSGISKKYCYKSTITTKKSALVRVQKLTPALLLCIVTLTFELLTLK